MQLYYELQTLATKYPKFGSIFEIINMSFLSSLEPLSNIYDIALKFKFDEIKCLQIKSIFENGF